MIRPDIQSKIDEIKDIKLNMRNSIHSRNVEIDANTIFKDYPKKIDEIPEPNYLYAISGNWDGNLDTVYFNADVHYIPAFTCAKIDVNKVVIHKDIFEFGEAAFAQVVRVDEFLMYPVTPPKLGNIALIELPSSTKIKVPKDSVEQYKLADGWSAFSAQIEGY